MEFTLDFVRRYAGLPADSVPDTVLAGVSIDTRTLVRGALFAALTGDRFDGHDFMEKAVDRGCAAILARHPPSPPLPVPLLLVDDVLAALSRVALGWRQQVSPLVVAVTGSSGKTTVKEMIARCLRQYFQRVHATPGNFNNSIGLPLTLLAMPADCQALVVEMGMSGAGEIAHLTHLARPWIGVITNIQPAHMASFSSLEGVADAKGELFTGLPENGIAVFGHREPWAERLHNKAGGRTVVRFGVTPAGYRLPGTLGGDKGFCFGLRWPDEEPVEVCFPCPGEHMLENALAAAAVARTAGVSAQQIAAGLSGFAPPAGRGRLQRCRGGWLVVDDSYNANPGSVRAALLALPEPASEGRRVAVLGDMLELGEQARKLHAELAPVVVESGVTLLFTAGPHMAALGRAVAKQTGVAVYHRDDPAHWLGNIAPLLVPGDRVLVKGSRGMKMERIVQDLADHVI